jgi:hypothetical protein
MDGSSPEVGVCDPDTDPLPQTGRELGADRKNDNSGLRNFLCRSFDRHTGLGLSEGLFDFTLRLKDADQLFDSIAKIIMTLSRSTWPDSGEWH